MLKEHKYCPECGSALERHVVAGEARNHWRCTACGQLDYDYPMVVVTAFVANEDRLLWVQRGISHRRPCSRQRGPRIVPAGETHSRRSWRTWPTPSSLFSHPAFGQLSKTNYVTCAARWIPFFFFLGRNRLMTQIRRGEMKILQQLVYCTRIFEIRILVAVR